MFGRLEFIKFNSKDDLFINHCSKSCVLKLIEQNQDTYYNADVLEVIFHKIPILYPFAFLYKIPLFSILPKRLFKKYF